MSNYNAFGSTLGEGAVIDMAFRKKIHEDIARLKHYYEVRDVVLDDRCLTLTVNNGDSDELFSFFLDNYPSESVVFHNGEQKVLAGRLFEIVEECLDLGMDDDMDMDSFGSMDGDSFDFEDVVSVLDIEENNYKLLFGENIKVTRLLEQSYVEFSFEPLELLDMHVAQAWGIFIEYPIVFRIHIIDEGMGTAPRVEVFQPVDREKYTKLAISQIEQILNDFTSQCYNLQYYQSQRVQDIDLSDIVFSGHSLIDVCKILYFEQGDILLDPRVDIELLSQLITMGFEREDCITVLLLTHNDFSLSVEKLVNTTEFKNTLKIEETKADKVTPNEMNFKYGYLSSLTAYMIRRIKNLNEFCVICDDHHLFVKSMLKPAVCTREICCWSFQELGVGANSADFVATGYQVIEMLIKFAKCASTSGRNNIIFDPFPTIFNPTNNTIKELDANNPDFGKASFIISQIPEIETLMNNDMKYTLDNINELCHPVFQWIMQSNRSHITTLPEEVRIGSFPDAQQFLLLSSPPEKEKKFQELKKEHGSCFAFHGSGPENWHSILRNGLYNASDTKYQVNGKAYGAGIYFSPQASMSLGYAKTQSGFSCMAICEVIPSNGFSKKTNTIWVHPDSDCCVTRFLILIEETKQPSLRPRIQTLNTTQSTDDSFIKELEQAMNYYGL